MNYSRVNTRHKDVPPLAEWPMQASEKQGNSRITASVSEVPNPIGMDTYWIAGLIMTDSMAVDTEGKRTGGGVTDAPRATGKLL